MLKIGLDLGTGFVKCMSDYGSVRFPSVYVKRIHGNWTNKMSKAVGNDAAKMINTMGTSVIKPINKGRPDSRYQKQVEILISESISQGTTEFVVIDKFVVIDGESSQWASDFITKKIGKFAHLDIAEITKNRSICRKYSNILAENIAQEVQEISDTYKNQYNIALSGGGLLLPGVKDDLTSKLEKFKIAIPGDPVMSNARALYKLVK